MKYLQDPGIARGLIVAILNVTISDCYVQKKGKECLHCGTHTINRRYCHECGDEDLIEQPEAYVYRAKALDWIEKDPAGTCDVMCDYAGISREDLLSLCSQDPTNLRTMMRAKGKKTKTPLESSPALESVAGSTMI